MARATQQSAGAMTVWMIIFAALWLTSTVFLIVLYTGQSELTADNDRLRRANARWASSQEQQSIELIKNLVDGGPTAVGILEDARRQTARLATGDEADDATTVRSKRDSLVDEIRRDALVSDADGFRDASLLEGMSRLYAAFKAQHGQLGDASSRLEELGSEVARLGQENTEQADGFEQQIAELGKTVVASESGRADERARRDQAVETLQREFESRRAQNDADLDEERRRNAQLERDLSELRQRFTAQEEKFGALMIGPAVLATAREPDGRILTAIPGDNVVYIDLGRGHRLILGLQFAVYAADASIPADGRAKAQIEVVSISQASAECSILWVAQNQIIEQDDLIANPVYDRSRAQAFLIIGEFDLNRDGIADSGGKAVVASLVSDWGGTVTNELTVRTDFVVLGAAPPKPRGEGRRDLSAEQAAQRSRAQAVWDRYVDTVTTAKALSVPVLSQDVFLNFLGYRGHRSRR
ncbi:MAG: hypothetical protein IID43_05720 [Planctomycetes bacterium]|nr:hypothetical protein [Planctomycetota bacterium]